MGPFILALSILSVLFLLTLAALIVTIRRTVALQKVAQKRSNLDEMTELYTKNSFMREGQKFLEASQRAGRNVILIIFDVDKYGKITSLFGDTIGEEVIRAFASSLKAIASDGDVFARVDTDDFALLTYGDTSHADQIVDRFDKALDLFISGEALRRQVNFFAGICSFDGQDDIYTLFNKANLCLVDNQQDTRYATFNAELENKMIENELMRSEMIQALEHGQFELYYQPKVEFRTGKLCGVEALIRWHHPTKGFVPPGDFIPLAESTGLITKIDEWGLFTACRQCKMWQDSGLEPIKISVNMSQAQFFRTDVYSTVLRALEETGLDPHWLEIEVTETMAMQDVDHTIEVLNKIRSLGVSISMDDFGSGYSSLASLKTLPLDVLKIDRSLVCDLNENDISKRIANAIVELGKAMSLVILAEGVETLEQCDFLSQIGCDLAQGYYYSKPRPASEIEKMLRIA